jgi:hypothetical protein
VLDEFAIHERIDFDRPGATQIAARIDAAHNRRGGRRCEWRLQSCIEQACLLGIGLKHCLNLRIEQTVLLGRFADWHKGLLQLIGIHDLTISDQLY